MQPQESKDNQEIRSFYNGFRKKQISTGVNLRHYMVFDKCLKAGLQRNHQVLEMGCGIGTFTGLLAKYLTQGSVTATDISNESIEEARKRLEHCKNVSLIASDLGAFDPGKIFDFVVLVDVLEHIPFDRYDQLFGFIGKNTHPDSIIAFNIPHPDMIRHISAHQPEMLQIIDNPVEMDYLSSKAYPCHLRLSGYEPYCIHNEDQDYIFMTFEKSDKIKKFKTLKSLQMKKRKFFYTIKYFKSLFS